MKSFGLNDGRPDGEIVIIIDDDGAVISAKNVITDTEYVGGGGDSDFSTAEVIFNCFNNTTFCECYGIKCLDEGGFATYYEVENGEVETITVPIYKNTPSEIEITIGEGATFALSGDLTNEDNIIIVSGNGTITIS